MDDIATAEFEGKDFDARELVMKYRRRMPLSQLQKSLSAHKTAIRQELIELINEKYSDFVSLSSRMQGVEQALRPLRTPLEESRSIAGGFRERLGDLLSQSDAKFQELANVASRRRAIAAYIENARLLQKTKDATAGQWGNPQEAGDFLQAYTAHENIAKDLQRIRLNLTLDGKAVEAQESSAPDAGTTASASSAVPKSFDFAPAARDSQSASAPEKEEGDKTAAAAASSSEGADKSIAASSAALLVESRAFEATFVEKLQEQLLSLLETVRRGWDQTEDTEQREAHIRTELLAIASVCRALVTLDRHSAIETTFGRVFVRGALEAATAACTAAAEDPSKKSAGTSQGIGTTDLAPFFSLVLGTLLAQDSALLWVAQRLHSQDDPAAAPFAVPSMHLLADAVVNPVLAHVQNTWPNVFMPAFPDIFVSNYGQSLQFLREAETLMLPAERRHLRNSKALLEFKKKWKTQVYFSLRTKEMGQRLDSVVSAGDGQSFEQRYSYDGKVFYLRTSVEVVRQLRHIWSDRVYLDVLFAKALRLTLEILARYVSFVQGLATQIADAPAEGSSPGTKIPCIVSDVLAVVREIQVVDAAAEKEVVAGEEEGRATKLILARLPSGEDANVAENQALAAAVRGTLRESALSMQTPLKAFEEVLTKQLTTVIAPQFAAIRGIPAVYRMTNKPVPTRPSPYVESALKPIHSLHETSSPIVPKETLAEWTLHIADAAAEDFGTHAAQLMEAVQQQEASLARLQKRPTSDAAANASDLDKIYIQLCLDVETFCKSCEAEPFAVSPSATGLAKLRAIVAPVLHIAEAHREK